MADPITAAVVGALGVQAGTTAASVIGFGVSLGISAVSSYALAALSPQPKAPGQGGFLVNEVNPTAPAEYAYGEVRKGGVVTYDEATDDNGILHRIIVLGAGEYDVTDIYLNDEIVTLSDNAFSLTDPSSSDGESWSGAGWVLTDKWTEDNVVQEPRIRVLVHDGSQTATTDTFANSNSATLANTLIADSDNGLDSNFVGNGLCYLYVYFIYDSEGVFAGGIPKITAKVRRKGIYDPRDDTSKYTGNWALCLADYLQSDYGLGDTGSVDDTALQVQANICAELVSLDAGGTQSRYQMNGVFRADEQPGQILSRMMPSGAGQLFWGQGKWNIRAGEYEGSVASFTLDDLRSAISVETRTPRAQNYNAIRGVFNDKSQRYIEGEYPRISSATFLSEDGGFENVLDYDLPFETDGIRAQRLAKLALYRQREQIRVEADFNMRAASVQPGDVIDLTVDRYGWDAKEFEVVGWTLKISETGTLCVRMSLKETSEDAYDWNAEETVFSANNTSLPTRQATAAVSLGDPVISYIQNPGGTEQPLVTIPWSVTGASLVADYVFEWRKSIVDYSANGGLATLPLNPTAREQLVWDAYFKALGRAPGVNGFAYYVSGGGAGQDFDALIEEFGSSTEGQNQEPFQSIVTKATQAELRGLSFDEYYDFRIYARNLRGTRSASDAETYLVEPDTETPDLPTSITATGGFKYITIEWTNPTNRDLSHIELWEADSDDSSAATLIANVKDNFFVRTNLGILETKWYFLKAVDYTGNKSAFTTGVSGETTGLGDPDFENGIRTLFEDQGLYPIEDVDNLLTPGTVAGRKYFNRDDGKLYEWDGLSYEPVIPEIEAGSITATEIADNSISTGKLQANAVTAAKIAAGTITGNKIAANTITGGLIASSGIITNTAQIGDSLITNAKIGNAAVDTLQINDEAVIVPYSYTNTINKSGTGDNSSNWKLLHNISYTLPVSAKLTILWIGTHIYTDTGGHGVRLLIDGVQQQFWGGGATQDYPAILWSETKAAATYTIRMEWRGATTITLDTDTIVILGAMK